MYRNFWNFSKLKNLVVILVEVEQEMVRDDL